MAFEQLKNKIDNLKSFEKKRENLSFDGFLNQIDSNSLLKFYQESKKYEIPVRETAHNVFIYSLVDQIQQKFKLKKDDITKVFVDMTEFDSVFRNEFAYIGHESTLSNLIKEILDKKFSNLESFTNEKGINIKQEIQEIYKIIVKLSNESKDETGEVNHYFKGASMKYNDLSK